MRLIVQVMWYCIKWLFIVLPTFAWAQQYQFKVRHVTMNDGLPNDYVTHAMLSRNGFVWVSTNFSLARFDGYEFREVPINEKYRYPPYSTYEDANGLLWINHFAVSNQADWFIKDEKILDIYDPVTESIIPFDKKFGVLSALKTAHIAHLGTDRKHNIWIVTTEGAIVRYDGSTFQKIASLPDSIMQRERNFFFRMAIQENAIWIVTGEPSKLLKIDSNGKINNISIRDNIDRICIDGNNDLWLSFQRTFTLWHKRKNQDFEVLNLRMVDALPDAKYNPRLLGVNTQQRQIWYLCNDKLYVFSLEGKLIAKEDNIKFPRSNHSFIDPYDNVWLSTARGLYIVSLVKDRFTNYLEALGIQDTRQIVADPSGDVFVAQGTIHNLKKHIKYDVPGFSFISLVKVGDTFWGAPYNGNIYKYNIANGQKLRAILDTASSRGRVGDFKFHFSKKTGKLWVGGKNFLGTVDTATLAISKFQQWNDYATLKAAFIKNFFENEEGIWLLTDDGLYLLDETMGIVAHYAVQFPVKSFMHLHEDAQGIFWIATKRGGLLRWDRKNQEVKQFTKKNGLSNDVIYAVYEDDYGYLWLPSNYGLMRFNKETQQVNVYLPEDGIPHQEFNGLSHARGFDGRLYFGGLGGVTSFDPKDFLGDEEKQAPLRITAFEKLDGRTGKRANFTQELFQKGCIQLRPFEKSFQIQLALLNFNKPKENRYAYRIENLENNWTYIHENYIRFAGLPHGTYQLHIKAQDINQRWAEQELSIPIEVIKPFYLRWWFILASVVSIFLLGILVAKWRTRKLKAEKLYLENEVARRTATIERQANELKALDEQKSRFFLNIAHELRTPLTLIATPIQHFIQQESRNEKVSGFLHSIQKNVQHLSTLVESILDISKLDAGQLKLNEQPVDFSSLIRSTFSMFESYAKMHRIHYDLVYEASQNLRLLLDLPKFEKIVHNLLFNALKFTGQGGYVKLRVVELERQIQIEVLDTGSGIHPEDLPHIFERYFQSNQKNASVQGGSGIGLSIAWEYARLMGGNLKVDSQVGQGSGFMLLLPKKVVTESTVPTESALATSGENVNVLPNHQNGKRIQTLLVVEDNVEMQALLQQIIEPHYHVLQAANGALALDILKQQSVDGVITDLMMPTMDGFELLKCLKTHNSWQFIPVVMLTARANEEDKLNALRIGVDDYLYKPFSPQEVLIRIENLLAHRQQRLDYLQSINDEEPQENLTPDQQWLREVETTAIALLNKNPQFKITDLAESVYLSERHFRRKIQAATGLTANDYLKEIRLQRARQLLERKTVRTVSEVAYAVGFTSASYFTKIFAQRFGWKPSDYL